MAHQEEPLSFIVKPDDGSRMLHAPKSELDKAEKIIIDMSEGTALKLTTTLPTTCATLPSQNIH